MLLASANGKDADQTAHPLISAFVVRYLDSMPTPVSIVAISRLHLPSEATQASLSLT